MSEKSNFKIVVFFGWFGLHKFLQKKWISGFVYLFTLGIFCIGWFVDIFIAYSNLKNSLSSKPSSKTCENNSIYDQLFLYLDPEFVSFVLPMVKSEVSNDRIACAYSSSHPDFQCSDLFPKIRYVESYFSSVTELYSLSECDADRYVILSCDDDKLCDTCRKYKGMSLPVSSAKIGYNCPPFHLGCRCCIGIDSNF